MRIDLIKHIKIAVCRVRQFFQRIFNPYYIPPFAVLVVGGKLPQRGIELISEYCKMSRRGEDPGVLVIEAEPGTAQLDIVFLSHGDRLPKVKLMQPTQERPMSGVDVGALRADEKLQPWPLSGDEEWRS